MISNTQEGDYLRSRRYYTTLSLLCHLQWTVECDDSRRRMGRNREISYSTTTSTGARRFQAGCPLQVDEQDGDVGRVDARKARGLAQGGGPKPG